MKKEKKTVTGELVVCNCSIKIKIKNFNKENAKSHRADNKTVRLKTNFVMVTNQVAFMMFYMY